MALALYRKYRPRSLADLLGQETIVHVLRRAAELDQLGHAYLFYGPRGTGKTTSARLIAKLLNCKRRAEDTSFRKKGEPCNACVPCREIDAGTSLDVIEIDAASNRGIEEMRNLKESIRIAPTSGRSKVYIIDEAHMLTGPAMNALLKTLEEPPPHGVLILATTEYEKLPATVTSRTQRFLFRKIPKSALIQKLAAIAKEENIAIDKDAVDLVAAASEGSFRDAESLLDQLRSLGKAISLDAVERLTGRVGLKKVEALARAILSQNLKEALVILADAHEEGQNVVEFTRTLIHYLRKLLTLHMNPALESVIGADLTREEMETAKDLASRISPPREIPLIKSLLRGYSEMRYSPFASIPLEVALIEHLGGRGLTNH